MGSWDLSLCSELLVRCWVPEVRSAAVNAEHFVVLLMNWCHECQHDYSSYFCHCYFCYDYTTYHRPYALNVEEATLSSEVLEPQST